MGSWRLIAFLAFLGLVSSLPLLQPQETKRAKTSAQEHGVFKRAAEAVIVGNHQNKERTKKSMPPPIDRPETPQETKTDETRDDGATVKVSGEVAQPPVDKSDEANNVAAEEDSNVKAPVLVEGPVVLDDKIMPEDDLEEALEAATKVKEDETESELLEAGNKELDMDEILSQLHLPENSPFRNYRRRTDPRELRWNPNLRKRRATEHARESSMSLINQKLAPSRSKRETMYPFLLDEPYKRDLPSNYPDYPSEETDYPELLDTPNQGYTSPLTDAEVDDILHELAYEVLPEAEAEAEAEADEIENINGPYYGEEAGPYPYYRPDETIPSKRQMLSMMPGIKRNGGDSFYPYENIEDPWVALIPKAAAEKRSIENQYERLYELAEALRRERRSARDEAMDELLSYYQSEKKKK